MPKCLLLLAPTDRHSYILSSVHSLHSTPTTERYTKSSHLRSSSSPTQLHIIILALRVSDEFDNVHGMELKIPSGWRFVGFLVNKICGFCPPRQVVLGGFYQEVIIEDSAE